MTRFAVLLVLFGTTACSFGGDDTFRGIYITAFEASAFRQCGRTDYYWLTDASGDLHAQLPPGNGELDDARAAYIEVKGRRNGPGEFGHLGGSTYELVVNEVMTVSADTTGKC